MAALFKAHAIETVVHFAASCYVGESQEKPAKYFHNNVTQTLNLMAEMEAAGVRRLVFSSSCATFGNPHTLPMNEDHPQAPINVYGVTKLMAENALRGYQVSKGWSFVALRYFNAAGADESGRLGERHDPETHLIPLVLQAAAGKRPSVQIYGEDYETPDGTCIRDYVHVNDLADAHIAAIEYATAHPGGEVFNLGTATGASVREVIDTCERITGRDVPVEITARRPGDPASLVADASKAKNLLKWTPQYDLSRIVETAWRFHQG